MKTSLFIFLFIIGQTTGLCQNLTVETSVYFDSDKYTLRANEIIKLNALTDSIQHLAIDSIRISGNTDNKASNTYNIALSRNRSESVQQYLHTKGIKNSLIQLVFFGEEKTKSI